MKKIITKKYFKLVFFVIPVFGLMFLLFQNLTLNEFINTINVTNPGKIYIKTGVMDPAVGGLSENTTDGGVKITVNMDRGDAGGINTVRHELMHATSHLNDDPFNFQITGRPVEGLPEATEFHKAYDNNFHASEVSAYFTQRAMKAEYLTSLGKESPANLLATANAPDPFGPIYNTATKAVNDIYSVLTKPGVVDSLINNAKTPNGELSLTVPGHVVTLSCRCDATAPVNIALSKQVPGLPGQTAKQWRKSAVDAILKKLEAFKEITPQMSPTSPNGKALNAKNAAAKKKAVDDAQAAILKGSSPVPTRRPTRSISSVSSSSSGGRPAIDVNPEVKVKTFTITVGDSIDPLTGAIIAPGWTYTGVMPVNDEGEYNNSDNDETHDDGETTDSTEN